MFQFSYQAGPCVDILDIKGSKDKERNEDKLFKASHPNAIVKVFDKTIKSIEMGSLHILRLVLGYLYEIDGSNKTKIQFPKDEKQELGLTQRFLVFQVFIPFDSSFSLETMITDTSKTKRRLIFTSNVKDIEKTHFHTKIPLDNIKKGVWLNLSFDLVSFFGLFTGSTFRSLDGFVISGACKLRKIFTMKNQLVDFSSCDEDASSPYADSQAMNKTLNFAPGIVYNNQTIAYSPAQKISHSQQNQRELSPISRINDTSIQASTGSFHITSGYGSSIRLKDRDSLSPIPKKPRRNISLHIQDYGPIKETEVKEKRSVSPNKIGGEPSSTTLLSTGDSYRNYRLGRRVVCSPSHGQVSFEKMRNKFSKTPTIGEIVTPKSSTNKDQKMFIFKAPEENNEPKNKGAEEKRKAISVILRANSKKASVKAQEIAELGDKISLLAKKPREKISTGNYFLSDLSPKISSATPKGITSIRSKNEKNPWSFSELSLRSAKNLRNKNERSQESPLRLTEISERKECIQPKKIEEKVQACSVRKEVITTKTTQATSKDLTGDSERFSTFYRSRDENPWFSYKENESLRPAATINDDIESIEENLEYEVNSNTSGVCGSRNMLDHKGKVWNIDMETDSVLDKKTRNIGTPDLYRMFSRNENVEDNSTDLLGRFESKSIYRNTNRMNEMDDGKTKKKLNQLEEKVKNIVTNSRPFSPPFVSKIMKTRFDSQVADQEGASEVLDVKEISSFNRFASRNKLVSEREQEDEEDKNNPQWKQFYAAKKV